MDDLHYNCIKPVMAEKNKKGTWLSEQDGKKPLNGIKMDDEQSAAVCGATLRYRALPRRGCEGFISRFKMNIRNKKEAMKFERLFPFS